MIHKKHLLGLMPFAWFPCAVLVLHFIFSWGCDAYGYFSRLDIFMHFIGGTAIAYFFWNALRYMEDQRIVETLDKRLLPLLVFALVATAAVFWEFAEFLSDRFTGANSQISLANTMRDQCFGLLGGALYIVWKEVARTRR